MSAPVNQDRAQTTEEHGSQSPKSTDTPGIYRNLVKKKYGSRAPKIHEKLKATHQENQE